MPTTYFVGMSSLALQLLYRMFNAEPDVVCERIFWEKGGAQSGKPLESIESRRTPDEFDVWAFTISWEMDYFNVIEMLRQAGIPPRAADRQESRQWDGRPWPLLIAGGPGVTMNPEPMAPIFDAILIGEGEEAVPHLVDLCRAACDDQRHGRARRPAGRAGSHAGLVCAVAAPLQPEPRRLSPGGAPLGAPPARLRHDQHALHARHRVRQHAPDGDRARLRPRLPLLPGRLCLPAGARAAARPPAGLGRTRHRRGARPRSGS